MRIALLLVSTLWLACACSSQPAASPGPAAPPGGETLTIAVTPTTIVHGAGPIQATFSSPIPSKPGKRYRISLSTPDAATYAGPSHFLEAGATKDELRPVEAGTFDVRILESDGPDCGDGTPGPCARNEHVIAKSDQITVSKKPE
jgi:hypothetical protein